MQCPSDSSSSASPGRLEVVLDGSIFGVSEVYPSQRAGIWRYLREWTRAMAARSDVSLHLVSSGRARWNELALEQVRKSDPFLARLPHQWHPRDSPIPGWRPLQSLLGGIAFRMLRPRLRPTQLAGILQVLQQGLARFPRDLPSQGVYHSPYHALPPLRTHGNSKNPLVRSITVHDMIPKLFPEWFDGTTPFQDATASIGLRDHVFTTSENTRLDILRLLDLPAENVHVAYPGVSDFFAPIDPQVGRERLDRLGIPRERFLLTLGTLEPRKNLPSLLQAFQRIALRPGFEDLRLVMTGARGWKNTVLEQTLAGLGELRERIILTGFLADEDLPALFGACEAFVFPSLYEGFGLPIVEAQACGAAVVCVENSSQTEVAGQAAILARDGSPQALEAALLEAFDAPGTLEGLRRLGPANARRFRWDRCIEIHHQVWREALLDHKGIV